MATEPSLDAQQLRVELRIDLELDVNFFIHSELNFTNRSDSSTEDSKNIAYARALMDVVDKYYEQTKAKLLGGTLAIPSTRPMLRPS